MDPREGERMRRFGLALLAAAPLVLVAGSLVQIAAPFPAPHEVSAGAMEGVLAAALDFARSRGRFPRSLDEIPPRLDGRAVPRRDAWGEPLHYELRGDGLLVLQTLGRDAAPGGEGADRDLFRCAATRRADGALQLEAPGGGPLRFLEPWELTVYELARGAREVDRRLAAGSGEEALEAVRAVPLEDGWGRRVEVQVIVELGLVRLVSRGADGAPGAAAGGLAQDHDRVAERSFAPARAAAEPARASWETYLEPPRADTPRRGLGELERQIRGGGDAAPRGR